MENQELFTDKITKGNRTYFFDVKRAENGGLFLSISESKRTEAGFQKYNIVIFEEDIEDVKRVFNRVVKKLGALSAGGEEKGHLDTIRADYPQAYLPWSAEDDEKLEVLYCEGKTVKELVAIFERQPGAIRSRIKKLELREKYG